MSDYLWLHGLQHARLLCTLLSLFGGFGGGLQEPCDRTMTWPLEQRMWPQEVCNNSPHPSITFPRKRLYWNLYAGQEATVRTGHGTTDWFQIGKGVHQGCILSPCLFNLYAEYILRNAGLEEVQAGIKIARRKINNLRYADDTTLMAESEEELKSLLMKVKVESEKA